MSYFKYFNTKLTLCTFTFDSKIICFLTYFDGSCYPLMRGPYHAKFNDNNIYFFPYL
jgi:hypothetical protein